MGEKQSRSFQLTIALIVVALVTGAILQYVAVTSFNEKDHSTQGAASSDGIGIVIEPRGGNTSSWYKQDTGLTGQTFDATLKNESPDKLNTWTLRIDIAGPCYLNQFWNGTVEVHQFLESGKELVQTLNLANYNLADIELDYTTDASDLLIPLKSGDYIVYHPNTDFKEVPIESGNDTVVGAIFYYKDAIDLSNYQLNFRLHEDYTNGPGFIMVVALALALVLVATMYLTSWLAYRRARKEMRLRQSGLSCMTELYALIYIVDLIDDVLTPVGIREEFDRGRPKELPASKQVARMFEIEPMEPYLELAAEFGDISTLPERLAKRNSVTFEYESRRYGWSRVRFIAMERGQDGSLQKVLFTVRQIDDEKRELESALMQVEQAHSDDLAGRELLDRVSRDMRAPLTSMLELAETIANESADDQIQDYARELTVTGQLLLAFIEHAMHRPAEQVQDDRQGLSEYSLSALVDDVQKTAQERADRLGINFQIGESLSIPDALHGDARRLELAISGLLAHVIESGESESVQLRVFGKALDNAQAHLLVSVRSKLKAGTAKPQGASSSTKMQDLQSSSGVAIDLSRALIEQMGSELKSAEMFDGGNDLYFELEQPIAGQPDGPSSNDVKAD